MYGMPADSSGARKERPCWLYDPTTATTFSSAARRAHFAAVTVWLRSLQVRIFSSWPLMPPLALTQRAYALAMAGMPGLFVAAVFSGAQVMTVTEPSPEPPWSRGWPRTPRRVTHTPPAWWP